MGRVLFILLLITSFGFAQITKIDIATSSVTTDRLYVNNYDIGTFLRDTTYSDSMKMWTVGSDVIILDSIYTSSIAANLYQDTVTISGLYLKFLVDISTSGTYQDTIVIEHDGSNSPLTKYVDWVVIADSIPDAFTFTDITLADLGTEYTSNWASLSNYDSATVQANGNSYRTTLNGAWTTTDSVISSDSIQTKITSSDLTATAVNSLITVGGISDTYTVTTLSPTTYYVDNTGTGDTLSTLAEVNALALNPGDSVLFKRGCTWKVGSLAVTTSGTSNYPIVFSDYGSGDKPIIDGADIITGMTEYTTDVWQKTGITTQPNVVCLNDTVGIPQSSIVNCDATGQWFWDSGTNILYIYSGTDPNGNVDMGQRKNLIDLNDEDYITLENLVILHSNEESGGYTGSGDSHDWDSGGIFSEEASHITIRSCEVKWSGFIGVLLLNTDNVTIDSCTFLYSGNSDMDGENVRIDIDSLHPGLRNYTFTNNISSYAGENGLLLTTTLKRNYVTNVEVSGNTFEHCFDTGVYLQRGDSAVIYNNTFDSCGDSADSGEDYAIGIGDYDNLDIYDNTITNQRYNDAIQIYADNRAISGSAHNVRIFRNSIDTVWNGNGIGINTYDSSSAENLQIYYNTITNIIDTIAPLNKYVISLNDGGDGLADTVQVYNNTMYVPEGVSAISATVDFPYILKNNIMSYTPIFNINTASSTTGLVSSNNLWHTNDGADRVLQYNSIVYTYTTITNFEATAQTGDPLFTTPGSDFSLQAGSPAINNGAVIDGWTFPTTDVMGNAISGTDILGNPIVGNPDIGAYEKQ